jgi:hypothetical protein
VKYLFIDDGDVERIDNLSRRLHQPRKFADNAVVCPENRWENRALQIRTTPAWDPEDGLYKMIYWAGAEAEDTEGPYDPSSGMWGGANYGCYATSEDGVNWEKPSLGLQEYRAANRGVAEENNILPSAHRLLLAPVLDAAESDSARRFKGLAHRKGNLQPVVTADGMDWQDVGSPISSSDEAHLTLDESKGQFIATVKHPGPYGRSFHLTTSTDFSEWSDQELVFHADQVDQENGVERLQRFFDDPAYLTPVYNRPEHYRTDVYNFAVFPYEGMYLATAVMHHWSGPPKPFYDNTDSRKSVELACSRDLHTWERVANRVPFLELSPVGDGSAYDTGQIVMTNRPLVRNGELWFYYTGLRYRCLSLADTQAGEYLDAGAICLARLRMDGFVSLKGGVEWGSVLTTPLRVEAAQLHVNVDAWRGRLAVEVLDADSQEPLPGYTRDDCVPAMVDHIDATIQWKERDDLAELVGRQVRLRFWLWQGELYAFWMQDGPA